MEQRRAPFGAELHFDPRRRRGRGRVQGVVHQVARDGHEAARIDEAVREQGPVGEAQADAPLRGDRALAHEESGQQRVAHLLGDLLGGAAVHSGDLGHELRRLVVETELQQAEEGVEPVGVLVVLGAQGLDQTAGGVQLPGQALQLGAVAQGGDGAAVLGRHPVGHQYPGALDGQQVAAGDAAREDVGGAARAEYVVQRAPRERVGGVRREAQQPGGFVVDQADAPAAVEGDHAFADGVQHRLRSASRAEMSEKARSRVCRWILRESRYAASAPAARAPPA